MTEYIIGPPGPQGIQGNLGHQGPEGSPGTSIVILGERASYAALPSFGNSPGDAYSTTLEGKLWIWSGNSWMDAGRWRGFQGPPGAPGYSGTDGAPGSPGAPGIPGDAKDLEQWVSSRADNLVTNGNGYLRNLTNFSQFHQYSLNDVPAGTSAAFFFVTQNGIALTDDRIPVAMGEEYKFKFYIRQTVSGMETATYSGGLAPYDIAGNQIFPAHYAYLPNTTTTLASDLRPGDMVVRLTNSANWYSGPDASRRALLVWNYTDQAGKVWGPHTYTRTISNPDAWAEGGINPTTHEITLKTPWNYALVPAGTSLSNNVRGDLYPWAVKDATVGLSWKLEDYNVVIKLQGATTASSGRSAATWSNGFPPGTVTVKPVWSLNNNRSGSIHAISGIFLSTTAVLREQVSGVIELAQNLDITLNQALQDIADAQLELDQTKLDLTQAQLDLQQAQADAEAAFGLSSQAAQDAQDAWNKAVEAEEGIDAAIAAAAEAAANSSSAITISISASNGTIFKDGITSTTLTAHVFKGGTELTEEQIDELGTLYWYKAPSPAQLWTGPIFIAASESRAAYEVRLIAH